MSKKSLGHCFICKRQFEPGKDKEEFLEAEGRRACRHHHGVKEWHKEAMAKPAPNPVDAEPNKAATV